MPKDSEKKRGRLRKQIMFRLMQKCGEDICYQCGEKIESIDTLSIEHKIPWLDSEDPAGLFFDLDNLAFSHMSCNFGAARKMKPQIHCPSDAAYSRGCRCQSCYDAHNEACRRRAKKRRDAGCLE